MIYDFIIIGGGIVGASTAWQLLERFPGKKVLVIEKENIGWIATSNGPQ